MSTSRRSLRLVLLTLAVTGVVACSEPASPTAAPATPGVRSPEENEPPPPVPTAQTGALGAAGLERALRVHGDDPAAARDLLREGCDRGTMPSCIALSEMLEADGSAAALSEARAVLEQACASGSTEACDRMGH